MTKPKPKPDPVEEPLEDYEPLPFEVAPEDDHDGDVLPTTGGDDDAN